MLSVPSRLHVTNWFWRKLKLTITLLISAAAFAGCATAPSTLNPQGPDAERTANLWWLMFAIAVVVMVVVTALLLIAILRRQHNAPERSLETQPTDRGAIVLILIGGAFVPAVVLLILMGLAVVAEQASASPQHGSGTVEVIGHQWWWEVRYPDQDIVTANEIHIPVGQSFLFKLTTADVIHSFWVPQLHGKIDMIPGQTNSIWIQADKAGTYRGECAEYCGVEHAKMDLIVVADTQSDFNTWLVNQQKPAPAPSNSTILEEGQQDFLGSSCVYCHTIKGTNASGTIGPDLTHLASRSTIGAGLLPNNPGNLAGWIVNSQALKPGNKMPPMDLNSDQVQSILAYLESLK
jgi:cytochrome c oxidase subunit 2